MDSTRGLRRQVTACIIGERSDLHRTASKKFVDFSKMVALLVVFMII